MAKPVGDSAKVKALLPDVTFACEEGSDPGSALDRMVEVLNDQFQDSDYSFSYEQFRFGEDGVGEIIMEHREDPGLNSRFVVGKESV